MARWAANRSPHGSVRPALVRALLARERPTPAPGVTAELRKLSHAYAHFEKLKAGEGRTEGYRVVAEDQLSELREREAIVHEVARYGAAYAVDSVALDELIGAGRIPIVHMGQLAGVRALQHRGTRWLDVLLWCVRGVAKKRLHQRGSVDIGDRLAAWDATLADLESLAEPSFALSIRTDLIAPAVAAATIHAVASGSTDQTLLRPVVQPCWH